MRKITKEDLTKEEMCLLEIGFTAMIDVCAENEKDLLGPLSSGLTSLSEKLGIDGMMPELFRKSEEIKKANILCDFISKLDENFIPKTETLMKRG